MGTQQIVVVKRNGAGQPFDMAKLERSIAGSFTDTGVSPAAGEVQAIADRVCKLSGAGAGSATTAKLGDAVEIELMRSDRFPQAKSYILYRDSRRRQRDASKLPSIFSRRANFKPFEFPDLVAFKKAIRHTFWTEEHWNFQGDIHDFHIRLTPRERNAVRRAILAISQVEVSVKMFWADLGKRFPKPEIIQVGLTFAESEVRHADAYSHLLQVLGLNDEFQTVLQVPAIRQRVAYLTEAMAGLGSVQDKDYAMTLALFSMFVENVSLFSQFAIIKSFNEFKKVLKDIDNVVQATQQEETIHALFGAALINHIKRERPEWFGPEFWSAIRAAAERAVDAEVAILDWIFEDGEMPFLPKATLVAFIQHRMNESLALIGGEPAFAPDAEALAKVEWFTNELNGEVSTDFFNKRPTTYSLNTKPVTADDLF